jgi:hypothetical protein
MNRHMELLEPMIAHPATSTLRRTANGWEVLGADNTTVWAYIEYGEATVYLKLNNTTIELSYIDAQDFCQALGELLWT